MKLCVAILLTAGSVLAEPPSMQELLDSAVANGRETLRLPPGRIPVHGRLRLQNADGLTIEGNDTTLVFSDHSGTAWSITACQDLTLKGFTIDFDPLPFVQGRITAISDDAKTYEFTVSEGYPGLRESDRKYYRQGYIFEPNRRRWKPWVPDLYARKVEIVDARHGQFIMGYTPPGHEHIKPGDRIALTFRAGAAIRMNNCENVRIEDVTFFAAPGAAYLGRYMRGDNYFRYTIKPGPPPEGATEPRLISTCADGLNIAFATKGPTIDRCNFSFMGDDSVNLHGVTLVVLETQSPTSLLAAWPYSSEWLATVIPPGCMARRLRPGNYQILSTAELAAFEPLTERTPKHLKTIRNIWPRGKKGRGTVFRLTFRKPFPAQPGDFVDFPQNNAPGFTIKNCVFQDHRARGLRIMASNGTIDNNTFRRLKMNAITIGTEYAFWREAGWVENVTVRGNTIEDVGRDAALQRTASYVLGAISTFGKPDPESGLPPWPGNRNIVIENNTVTGCPVAGIFAASATDVHIRGNTLRNVLYNVDEKAGTRVGIDVRDPIDTRHATRCTVTDNTLTDIGIPPPQ